VPKSVFIGTISVIALTIASTAYGQEPQSELNEDFAKILERIEHLEAENQAYKARLIEVEHGLAAPVVVQTSTAADVISTPDSAETSSDGNTGIIRFNHNYAYGMLDPTTNINSKQLYLLEQKQNGNLKSDAIYIGGAVTAIVDYWDSNRDSKFGYLMRHPTSNNQIGGTVSEAVIHSVQTNFTANIGDWVSVYGEFLYDPEQSFGMGTTTDLNRNQIQLRQGYVLFGNLDKTPFYAAIGKMTTPFGLTDTVNPFSASSNWHAFGGLANGAMIGYKKDGLHIRAEAVQGGAQFRAANTPVGDTNIPSKLNNYVIDANYTFGFGGGANDFMFGGSYERGSAYCQSFPVIHFDACEEANPAWAAYSRLRLGNFTLQSEYNETVDVWPGTFNPTPPLDIYPASKVSSFSLGGKYSTRIMDKRTDFSLDFSTFTAGPDGAPWERQNQWILGTAFFLSDSVKLFGEGVLVEGYSPLNFISGGNLLPGETHSDADAESVGAVLGVNVAF